MKRLIWALIGVSFGGGTAQAEIVDSVRVGVMNHNVRIIDPKNANKEDGVNISAEVRFSQLKFLGDTWSPYPYAMVSGNTAGATSFGAVGIEWDFEILDGWHFQPGFGYSIHNGELESEGATPEERAVFDSTHVLLGSRDLFRTSFALTKDINEQWGIQLIYDHLSHGQILGNGRNQGMDDVGVRIAYSF